MPPAHLVLRFFPLFLFQRAGEKSKSCQNPFFLCIHDIEVVNDAGIIWLLSSSDQLFRPVSSDPRTQLSYPSRRYSSLAGYRVHEALSFGGLGVPVQIHYRDTGSSKLASNISNIISFGLPIHHVITLMLENSVFAISTGNVICFGF